MRKLHPFLVFVSFLAIALALSGCHSSGPSVAYRGAGMLGRAAVRLIAAEQLTHPPKTSTSPSDPKDLAWLAACSEVAVSVAAPYVAPADGRLMPSDQLEPPAELAAHRLRLQDSVGHAVVMRLQQALPDKKVRYYRLGATSPFTSLPSGLTPSQTALCFISFEVVVLEEKPFLVKESPPSFSPVPEHWPEIPRNAVIPDARGFTESWHAWMQRLTASFGTQAPKDGGDTSPEELRACVDGWGAWYKTWWIARPADRAIYTLDASPSWSHSEKKFQALRLVAFVLGGNNTEFVTSTTYVKWDPQQLESAVSKWADLRGQNLAEQVVQALKLCEVGPPPRQSVASPDR